jgi:hypothetical protein
LLRRRRRNIDGEQDSCFIPLNRQDRAQSHG